MNWLGLILHIMTAVPSVVISVEQLAKSAPGSTKKDLALNALGLAYGTASQLLPQFQPEIDAATTLAGTTIDNTVKFLNLIGHPAFVPTPAVVPTPALRVAPAPALVPDGGTKIETTAFPTVETPAPAVQVTENVGGFHR